MKEIIAVAGTIDANEKNKNLINNTFKDNVKDLNIVMPMYKLLEYSNNGLWHQKIYGIIIEMK